MNCRIILFIVFFLLKIYNIKCVTVNAITFLYPERMALYYTLIEGFNEYSRNNNLDIELHLTVLSPDNSTTVINNYGTTLDQLLQKKSKKYDIYFYYSTYSEQYGPHFIDLREWLPNGHIDLFDSNIIRDSCLYDNKVVGLPINIDISSLYSNMELLEKYGEKIPKTWDELLRIGKYIMNEERKLNNNTNLMIYNGLFSDTDYGILSVYEFVNSFRDSNGQSYPAPRSNQTINALNMMKKLREEIGFDDFLLDEMVTLEKLSNGNALFLKFWYTNEHNTVFQATAMPGWKEGVSGSIVGGFNLGVSRYSDDFKRNATIEVVRFLTSKETQKDLIIRNNIFSAINELYMDEDVCKYVECNVSNLCQPFSVMKFNMNQNTLDNYVDKYRDYVFDYLYKNKALTDVIKKIDDMTRFYTISISKNDSNVGLYSFIIYLILSFIMTISIIFPYMKNLRRHYETLPRDFWLITIIGSFIIMSSILTLYGEITPIKCKLKTITKTMGFIISICPILYLLVINFPEDNKISYWIYRHKYNFVLFIISLEVMLDIMFYFAPNKVSEIILSEGENFRRCQKYDSYSLKVLYLKVIYEIIIIMSIVFFIFIEWSIERIYYDIRCILAAIIADIISLIIYNIFFIIDIRNYIEYNIIIITILLIFGFSNYTFIYGIRAFFSYFEKSKTEMEINKFIEGNKAFRDIVSSFGSSFSNGRHSSEHTKRRKSSFIPSKIMDYHYRSSISIHYRSSLSSSLTSK